MEEWVKKAARVATANVQILLKKVEIYIYIYILNIYILNIYISKKNFTLFFIQTICVLWIYRKAFDRVPCGVLWCFL